MSGDAHVRFWESVRVRFPRATQRVQGEAVHEMREGPSQPDYRIGLQTTVSCAGQEPVVVSVTGKGTTRSCQVGAGKTNASEPLMKCRKNKMMSKPRSHGCLGISPEGTCLLTGRHPVLRRRESGYRLVHGTLEPVASMPREKSKWRPHKDQSTDARHRDGTARSSVERRVMRRERRGRATQVLDKGSTVTVAGGIHV